MKKAIFVITLTLVALVIAGSAIGCTKKTNLTGTWTINSGGSFEANDGASGSGVFGRDFIITVKQENTTLQGTGKDVSQGRPADLVGKEVILNGEVKDGSKVTFTIHEDFPVMAPEGGHADLVHEFTGTVSGGKITGTFQGGFDAFGIKYRIKGQFVVSVGSAGSTTIPTTAANTATSTPTQTASQPMDLRGTWSGTHVQSGPGWTAYYNVVLNLTQQEKSLVTGTLALTVLRAEGSVVPMDLTIPFVGTVSGSTLQSAMMGMTCQVSGNSMTGSGTDTNSMGVTWDWSWNITRVP